MKLWNAFVEIAQAHSNSTALVHGKASLTYQELLEKSEALALLLKKNKIQEGSTLACYTGNNPSFVVSLLAASACGACLVPLDHSNKLPELQTILKNFAKDFHLILSTDSDPQLISESKSWLTLDLEGSVFETHLSPTNTFKDLTSIGMIQFTSGSTGEPKGILLSHEAVFERSHSLRESLGLNSKDRTLCAVPLTHSHGIDCLTLPTLLAGGTLFIYPPQLAAPTSILSLIEKEKITFFSSIPSFYELCLKLIKSQTYDLRSLRLPFCGSAALSEKTAEDFFEKFHVSIKQGYGLAEIGVICLNMQTDGDDLAYGSIGKPIHGIKFKVEQDELIVTSKALYSGYLNQGPPPTHDLFTGDLVQQDSKGRFYITGRKKDFINVSGLKVYPLEIEALIKQNLKVKDCVITAEADSITGERVAAYIELIDPTIDFESLADEVRTHLKSHLSDFKVPRKFLLYQNFPRSPLGKVLKSKLRIEDVISISD
jgi:long-chain acyl-CoA synthetase